MGSRVNKCRGALPHAACASFRRSLLFCPYWIVTTAKTTGGNRKTRCSTEVVQGHNECKQDKQRTEDTPVRRRSRSESSALRETAQKTRTSTPFNFSSLKSDGHFQSSVQGHVNSHERRRRAGQKRTRAITVQLWDLVREIVTSTGLGWERQHTGPLVAHVPIIWCP